MYMSTMRCCSAWKLPIGTPNCWRCLQYSTVSASTVHRTGGFGAHRRRTLVARAGQQQPAVVAQQRVGGQSQPVEHQIGGTPVVDGAVAVHPQPDGEQRRRIR